MTDSLKYKCECGYSGTGEMVLSECPECGNSGVKCTVSESHLPIAPYKQRFGWRCKLNRDTVYIDPAIEEGKDDD